MSMQQEISTPIAIQELARRTRKLGKKHTKRLGSRQLLICDKYTTEQRRPLRHSGETFF